MGANIFGQGGQFSSTVTANVAAVGAVGAAAPSYAIELGVIDVSGHLVGVSATNPIRVDPTGTTTQPVELNDGVNVMGIMAVFGTTPGAVRALNANASIFAGTVGLTATGSSLNVNITGGGGGAVTQGTSPWVISGAVTNAYLDYSLATIDTDIKANITLHAGTNVIGKVSQDTSPWVISGAVTLASTTISSGTITANQGTANATPWNDNVAQWGGVTVAAAASTSPAGTESAPVVRSIQRKYVSVSTTTPLAGGGTYTSSWIDTQQTGETAISVEYFADQTGASITIQETDNTSDGTFRTTASQTFPAASARLTIATAIGARYWRVVFVNGATPQGSFELTATGSQTSYLPLVQSSSNGLVPIQGSAGAIVGSRLVAGLVVNPLSHAATRDGVLNIVNLDNNTGTGCSQGVVAYAVTDGTTGGQASAIRTPNIFKDKSSATALGDTAVWTPASGKKFRVMRFQISVQGLSTTAAGGNVVITLRDATTGILHTFNINVPAVALTGAALLYESNWIDLGNGYLSALANNVLNVNLGTAFTAGGVDVFVAGTEE